MFPFINFNFKYKKKKILSIKKNKKIFKKKKN